VTHVGRGLGADLRFDEAAISRRHAALVVWPDGVRVLDERGGGGVRVNGRRVSAATLCDGDVIELGSVVLTFVAAPLAAAA
jgi:pSer/pThr/pTyr-binding forkhead associated (FHA) protein